MLASEHVRGRQIDRKSHKWLGWSFVTKKLTLFQRKPSPLSFESGEILFDNFFKHWEYIHCRPLSFDNPHVSRRRLSKYVGERPQQQRKNRLPYDVWVSRFRVARTAVNREWVFKTHTIQIFSRCFCHLEAIGFTIQLQLLSLTSQYLLSIY